MSNQKTMKAIVRDTTTIIFEGDVERISSFNEMGPFDVYPMHANFISIISKKIELYHNRQKVKELDLKQAVLKVKQDSVHIFVGIEALTLDEDPTISTPQQQKK